MVYSFFIYFIISVSLRTVYFAQLTNQNRLYYILNGTKYAPQKCGWINAPMKQTWTSLYVFMSVVKYDFCCLTNFPFVKRCVFIYLPLLHCASPPIPAYCFTGCLSKPAYLLHTIFSTVNGFSYFYLCVHVFDPYFWNLHSYDHIRLSKQCHFKFESIHLGNALTNLPFLMVGNFF